MNLSSRYWVPFFFAGISLLPSCGQKQGAQPPRPVRAVTVATAESRDVPVYLDEIGNCSAYEMVSVQPQVSGMLVDIHFKDGGEVKKGDLLFTIDKRPFQAALDKARATLEQDKAKDAFNQTQLQRNQELRKTKVVAQQELDNAISAAASSRATVMADQAAVEAAEINLDYCEIHSPIDGRTGKRQVDIGNVVTPNSATPLLVIQRQQPIYVDFTVPESALPRVRQFKAAGTLKVEASFADDPQKKREGDFDFLDSGVQPNSGTIRMRAILDNTDRLFWPGQFVNVRLLLDTMKGAVLVPNESLQVGQQGQFVFVVKPDSTVELRPVQPGQPQGDDVVISKGLKEGETVVVTGQIALAPGTQVKTTPAQRPGAENQKLSAQAQ
jgi:multidrug efflux system membrane fusion protein